MLTITVRREKQTIITADGLKMAVRASEICRDGEVRQFPNCAEFPETESLSIVVDRWFFGPTCVHIGEALEKGMQEYLHAFHAKCDEQFDCYAFANMVCGNEPHDVEYLLDFWDLTPIRSQVKEGDVVFLINKAENHFFHAAIYIGHGLYVSVYGAGGDLEFSTLRDMKRDFMSQKAVLATPLSNAITVR